MESSISLLNSNIYSPNPLFQGSFQTKDELIVDSLLDSDFSDDAVTFDGFSSGSALQIKAKELISKLNELLKTDLPDGIESLKPEDYTPEATADRIVNGIAAFYPAFRKQNPELSDSESLEKFTELATKGINQGYDQAFSTLENLGAFEFDGIKDTIEETKKLIFEKLSKFTDSIKNDIDLTDKIAGSVEDDILKGGGLSLSPTAEKNLLKEKLSEQKSLNIVA